MATKRVIKCRKCECNAEFAKLRHTAFVYCPSCKVYNALDLTGSDVPFEEFRNLALEKICQDPRIPNGTAFKIPIAAKDKEKLFSPHIHFVIADDV